MKRIILLTMLCLSAFMNINVFAEEISFTDADISPVSGMQRLCSIHLTEDENTINLSCSSYHKNDAYYISVYEKGEDAHYIVKYFGPIKINDFKISGLNGGKDYYVLLSSTVSRHNVSGNLYTSYTEVSKK